MLQFDVKKLAILPLQSSEIGVFSDLGRFEDEKVLKVLDNLEFRFV